MTDRVLAVDDVALIDRLTGLLSHTYLERHLQTLVREAVEEGHPLSLLVLDVDHFKAVTDGYGQAAGDAVLREFAGRLLKSIRGIDVACRVAGEQFLVTLPDTDAEEAQVVAERVRQAIARDRVRLPDRPDEMTVTVSIGISAFLGPQDTADGLVRRAHAALDRAKHEGPNRVVAAAA
jgi:two-component system, cell cycle response regulator